MWSQSSVGVWNDVTECLTLFPLRKWMIGEGDRSYINVQEKEYSSIVTWSFESGINISAVAEVAVSGIRKSWVIIASSISHWMFPKCEYIKCKCWSYSLVCNRFWMVSVWSLSSVRVWNGVTKWYRYSLSETERLERATDHILPFKQISEQPSKLIESDRDENNFETTTYIFTRQRVGLEQLQILVRTITIAMCYSVMSETEYSIFFMSTACLLLLMWTVYVWIINIHNDTCYMLFIYYTYFVLA